MTSRERGSASGMEPNSRYSKVEVTGSYAGASGTLEPIDQLQQRHP